MAETRTFQGPSAADEDEAPKVGGIASPTPDPNVKEAPPAPALEEVDEIIQATDAAAETPRNLQRDPVAPRGTPGRPTLREPPPADTRYVGVDTPITVILSLDADGSLLTFDDSLEGFLDLEEAVLDALGRENRLRYLIAAGTHARLVKEAANPESRRTKGLEVLGAHAPATERLAVEGKRKGMSYLWPLASEVRTKEREGYKVVSDPNVKTFSEGPGTSKAVSLHGEAEHVLMEKPEAEVLKHLHEIGRKSRSRALGAEEATRRDIIASGGVPLDPEDARRGRNWSAVPKDIS
jgi:hypothetical protein